MTSEQKVSSTGDNQPNPTVSSGEPINPTNDRERPSCCTTDADHKGEPGSHPVTGPPEERREQVDGANDGHGVNAGEGEGAGALERQKEGDKTAEEKAACENTSHQVTSVEVSAKKEEVPVALLLSLDESGPSEEERAVQGPQVTGTETEGHVLVKGTGPEMTQVTEEVTKVTEEVSKVTVEVTAPQVTGELKASQVTGEETAPQVMEETAPHVSDKETAPQVIGELKASQVTGEETAPQVTVAEIVPQVTEVTVPQVTGELKAPQVTGEETAPQVRGEETAPQVTGEVTAPQVTGEEKAPQVTGEETAPQVTGGVTAPQMTGEVTAPQVTGGVTAPQVTVAVEETGLKEAAEEPETQGVQVTGEETCPPKTDDFPSAEAALPESSEGAGPDEQRGAQVTDTGLQESKDAPVSHAGERWIDMLVHTIVTEATGEQDTDVQGPVDTTAERTEEKKHSTVQVTETMTGEQVTAQAAGAAAQVITDGQVSSNIPDIAPHVSGEEPEQQVGAEEETATPEQVKVTSTDRQVEEAAAQVTVTVEEVQEDISSNVEAGGQVTASGEEADREVTPDLVTLAGREGTLDQDQQAACREKEWPFLICTVSEVRTVTEAQGDTSQGSFTQKEASIDTPEMKEREIIEDGTSPTPETPIEREIRLTMEREMTLRQERGISSPIGQQPELVEVRRKTILVEPMAVPGKERQLAGAQMQREIQLETQREKDLVDLGKVMGTYDRGPQQELQEKKMIFESMRTEPTDAPIKKRQSEPQQQPKPQDSPPSNIPLSTNHVVPAKVTKKGPSYTEANGSNVIIIEHSSLLRRSAPGNTFSSTPADSRRSTPVDSRRPTPADSRRSTPADSRQSTSAQISYMNSSGPPLINSASTPVPSGSPFPLLQSPNPSSLLEREIEEVNERERELQRQRSSIYGRDETDGQTKQKSQEITSDVQSVYQPERPSWRKLEVNWPPNKEAEMNGQGLDSPRTRRQRSALIQSWERGSPNPKDDE
ncbi:uncharacterized protein MISP3 isoform 1-T5 [Anomaloglossus baeobatrachus]|uniref:uncharacterized protein MISP3 n=1 Tax=Anomaloglossus baeobatrachus TaxID=238106 RepID=UPI003F503120